MSENGQMAAACAPCQRCGGVADVSLTRDGKWLCVDCYDPAPPGPSPVSASQNGPAHADSAPIFRRDDQGNAERLVLEHGADLRFVPAIGWHFWDGVRWRRDDTGEAERRAKRTASGLYADIARVDDDEERKRILQHAIQSNRLPRIKAALELAQSDLAVVVRAAELDGHPMLLNVANGTVDLRTGQLRAHDRDEQHTKLAPVAYDPSARDRQLDQFLHDVTGGDDQLAAFLQRAAGYTLTGATDEEVLFFAHGPAATGKSTFLEALRACLGDYAVAADFEAFLARRGDSGVRSDIARLAGARLVTGAEVDDGKRLAEGLLKQLTGGDVVTARFLYRDEFEFRPQMKLWLAANARPRVSADDEAMWRRILQLPFVHVVPPGQRDPEVKRRLTSDPAARSAMLAWAVQGCLAWQRDGLQVPDAVRAYTAEYRDEQDPTAEWREGCCRLDPEAVTAVSELRASYEQWAAKNGEKPIGAKAFGALLERRGFRADRLTGGVRARRGLSIRSDA